MNDLRELYREVILDHNRNPRNFGELESADRQVNGVNPLCGDKMTLYLSLDGDRINDISFRGTGCAISVASSSLMSERVKGLAKDEAMELYELVHDMLTAPQWQQDADTLGKLAALGGVREYPSRVKCASLGWHALKAALASEDSDVTTE